MARPKKHIEPLVAKIEIRVSEKQKKDIYEQAEKHGESSADYLRRLVAGVRHKDQAAAAMVKLVQQLTAANFHLQRMKNIESLENKNKACLELLRKVLSNICNALNKEGNSTSPSKTTDTEVAQ